MAKWLLRNGYRYKRPHRVPHTVSVEKQEAFVKFYQEMKSSFPEDEVILFMDGVHPDHQTQAVCGWIQVGLNAQIPRGTLIVLVVILQITKNCSNIDQ